MNLTAAELIGHINADPLWIEKNATAQNPVDVIGFCDFGKSPIRRLSPFITFHGNPRTPADGASASFRSCNDLENAAGVFHGQVDFSDANVQEIDPNIVVFPDKQGNAANFGRCTKLKVARGTFHGTVYFSGARIEKIDADKLVITKSNERGTAASFQACTYLEVATGTYPGWVNFSQSGIREIKGLVVTSPNKYACAASFQSCMHLKTAKGSFNGNVLFECSNVVAVVGLEIVDPETHHVNLAHCKLLRDCQNDILNDPKTKFGSDEKLQQLKRQKLVRETMRSTQPDIEI